MRSKLLVALGLTALLLGGLSTASAASLPVGSATLATLQGGRCTPSTTATATDPVWWGLAGYEGVRVQMPAACVGKTVDVTLYRTDPAANRSMYTRGSATVTTAGALTVPTDRSFGGPWQEAVAIAVAVDGWSVPVG